MSGELVIRGFQELQSLGDVFARSGMFGCQTVQQGMVIAMTCMTEKMTPLNFMNTYHIIEGKPSMRSDAMLAKLLQLEGSYKIICRTEDTASIHVKYRDAEGTFTLTWKDAQQEDFVYAKDGKSLKKNWRTPRLSMQMRWARVVSDAVRAVCPLVNHGCYTPEEIQDLPPEESAIQYQPQPMTAAPVTPTTTALPQSSEPVPFAIEPEPEQSVEIIPVGKLKGKRWDSLNDTQLEKALTWNNEAITERHIEYIQEVIKSRMAATGAAGGNGTHGK
jgi:hypothetical protein